MFPLINVYPATGTVPYFIRLNFYIRSSAIHIYVYNYLRHFFTKNTALYHKYDKNVIFLVFEKDGRLWVVQFSSVPVVHADIKSIMQYETCH